MKIWIDDVRVAPKGYVWCKSMNPVGVENMRRIIERNGWKEV